MQIFGFSVSIYPCIDYFQVKIKFPIFHHVFTWDPNWDTDWERVNKFETSKICLKFFGATTYCKIYHIQTIEELFASYCYDLPIYLTSP